MSKFDKICASIQEAIGTNNTYSAFNTNAPKTANPLQTQQKTGTDLDSLANTLAKEQNPAVIKKALGVLVNPIPGAAQPNPNAANQPSISMTGTSGPTTSTTTQAGLRTQASTTNTGNPAPTPPQTNTQAAKQAISDQEIDNILKDVKVDKLIDTLKKRNINVGN